MTRLIERPLRPKPMVLMTPGASQTLDGFSLKKLGKKLKSAFKKKNLLKTAAIMATAYGGYKLVTSAAGKSALSKIGSGLVKAGTAAAKAAPKLASSYIAYKTASQPGMVPLEMDSAGFLQPSAAYAYEDGMVQTGLEELGTPQTSTTPSWLLPAGIGLGLVVLFLSNRE